MNPFGPKLSIHFIWFAFDFSLRVCFCNPSTASHPRNVIKTKGSQLKVNTAAIFDGVQLLSNLTK